MKKYLFFLPCMLLSAVVSAQSIKFNDLVYFTNLNNRQVYDNLLEGNTFRQDFSVINANGQEIETFKNIGNNPNTEKIVVGSYYKLNDGTLLRTVDYKSTDPQNIKNMIAQAKKYGLELKFRGSDNDNDIFLFDNNIYHVSIYLSRNPALKPDQMAGMVEIKQKEYLGVE